MTGDRALRADVIVVGAGLAGLVTALELLDRGRRVLLLERQGPAALGGLAREAFGGMHLVDTPLQRLQGIRDTPRLALEDWESFAEFEPGDDWPRRWAQHYVERCVPQVYEWLRARGLRFFPAVQWVERGWYVPGNSLPRYHVLWGTAQHLVQRLLELLEQHPQRARLALHTNHHVTGFIRREGRVQGCQGRIGGAVPFSAEAEHVVVACGGITGNLERVRRHWPADCGAPPAELLNGSHPSADGATHDAIAALGGRVTHLEHMWNYAAGVHHPKPRFAGHGLSLIPCRSALWMDHRGRRLGPQPLVTGFDTRELVRRVALSGAPWTWQVLNRRIALRELAASGAEHNAAIRDRQWLRFIGQVLRGNAPLVDALLGDCVDFVQAPDLPRLAAAMNRLTGGAEVDAATLEHDVRRYDDNAARPSKLHNDDQLRRLAQLRRWPGDRLRTCRFQPIADPSAGPLIAIRLHVLTRKSLGGVQTDLDSRVLDERGAAIDGLYAVGEAAGFGGGGASGKRSLEGTCLSGCILTARAAAASIVRGAAPATATPTPISRTTP